MQNSKLSSIIYPSLRDDWLLFSNNLDKELQDMITTYNNDKTRIRNLDRIINKLNEIKDLSKDSIEEVLNYKELFTYIDNSKELLNSFKALEYFKKQDNFDNAAVRTIYERIINSPKILQINSEYSSLVIKVQFDKERIKRLNELKNGSKIDYNLIRELVNKYKLTDEEKKNILMYQVVNLAIKQEKEQKDNYYHDRFNALCKNYQKKKDKYKDLLIRCINVREKMDFLEIDMYHTFISNPDEINVDSFDKNIIFKVYTLELLKIKKNIESFIDGISDLLMDDNKLDDELVSFEKDINKFDEIARKLNSLPVIDKKVSKKIENNVYFALDPFYRLIINGDLIKENFSSIDELLQNCGNDDTRISHMSDVEESEKNLGRDILLFKNNDIMLAYIMINNNILIISGDSIDNNEFSEMINRIIDHNIIAIKKQIELIQDNDLDYVDQQNRIVNSVLEGEKTKVA